jgi:probable rRNA maturation factor
MPDDPGSSRLAIDIRIAAAGWRKAFAAPPAAIRKAVRAALKSELPRGAATGLSILLTDDDEMRKLNAGWRAKDKPTNVLSFPAEAAVDPAAPPEYLGDIALGLATCRREAREQGKTLADHVAHLTVHGVLHLLGYDHMTKEEAAAMEPREVEILAGLGIADPYVRPARKPVAGKPAAKKAIKAKSVKKTTVKPVKPAKKKTTRPRRTRAA